MAMSRVSKLSAFAHAEDGRMKYFNWRIDSLQFNISENLIRHLSSSFGDGFLVLVVVSFFPPYLGKASKKNGKKAVRLTAWVDPPSPSPKAVRKM